MNDDDDTLPMPKQVKTPPAFSQKSMREGATGGMWSSWQYTTRDPIETVLQDKYWASAAAILSPMDAIEVVAFGDDGEPAGYAALRVRAVLLGGERVVGWITEWRRQTQGRGRNPDAILATGVEIETIILHRVAPAAAQAAAA